MKINAITMAAPATFSVPKKAVEKNPQVTNPIENRFPKQQTNDGSKAIMNYFFGMQNVPSFKGYPCSTGEFVVKQIDNVPCACCGAEMMNSKEQNEFVAKASKAKGEELANIFAENLHKIRRNERPVARELMERATKYPNQKLSDLADKDMDSRKLYNKENLIVLNNVDKKAQELYGEKNKVSKFVQSQKSLIEKNVRNGFGRGTFLANLKKLTADDQEKSQKVLTEAIELPLDEKGIAKVIQKVQSSDSTGIARRLIATAVMTTEHIHPKSQGGPNNTENYMGECAECNNNRGSENLNQYWQSTYPNMPSATQKYADYISEQIITGKMGTRYDDYMVDLEKAVESESKDAIDLKVLNPEEIDKARKERGLPDPKPLPVKPKPEKSETKKDETKISGSKKPQGSKKPHGGKKPTRRPNIKK